jgi:PhnB protein
MGSKAAKPIPDGYHTATPYLIVQGAASALEFYQRAFGAREMLRFPDPTNGKIGHAEIMIGDSRIMLADEYPDMGARSPRSIGGSPVAIMVYVDDVDAVVAQALAAGAKLQQAVEDKFYGDRTGSIEDPFGHLWHIATHKEDVSLEEVSRRVERAAAATKPSA